MKFKVGQKVKVLESQQTHKVIWVDLLGGRFYRLDNNGLYTESELEAVEETKREG